MSTSPRRTFWGSVEVDSLTGNVHVAPSSYLNATAGESGDLLEQIRKIGEISRKLNEAKKQAAEHPELEKEE
jgi:hypothetical protein